MKKHILESSKSEIEKNNTTLADYHTQGFIELLQTFVGRDFRSLFSMYCSEKKNILMSYASLYNDISQDLSTIDMSGEEIQNIKNSLIFLTNNIKKCSKKLEKLEAYNKIHKNLISEEQHFFILLLESFNADLITWINFHKKNIQRYIETVDTQINIDSKISNKPYGDMIKKRLSILLESIEKI